MEYPYIKIKRSQVYTFYNILVSFGYTSSFGIKTFLRRFFDIDDIYIVINDCNVFGRIGFYKVGMMSPNIKRTFMEDPYKFLKAAAKYKNCVEY